MGQVVVYKSCGARDTAEAVGMSSQGARWHWCGLWQSQCSGTAQLLLGVRRWLPGTLSLAAAGCAVPAAAACSAAASACAAGCSCLSHGLCLLGCLVPCTWSGPSCDRGRHPWMQACDPRGTGDQRKAAAALIIPLGRQACLPAGASNLCLPAPPWWGGALRRRHHQGLLARHFCADLP